MGEKGRIIMGIDPGTAIMGYGLIQVSTNHIKVIQYGIVDLQKYDCHAKKLEKIFSYILEIIDEFKPHDAALEAPFYGKNIQSMLKLGRVQGVVMAAALLRNISITEYAPRKVKLAVAGYGAASKDQVAHMLNSLLQLGNIPQRLDASDALAVAVCHAYQQYTAVKRSANWQDFIVKNPQFLL